MSLSRSQWLAVVGGVLLIAGAFVPLVVSEVVDIALVRSYEHASLRRIIDPFAGESSSVSSLWAALGATMILEGAASIILSVWISTSRWLFVIAICGVLSLGALYVSMTSTFELVGASHRGPGWLVLLAGQVLLIVASIIDRRAHNDFVRGGKSGDG